MESFWFYIELDMEHSRDLFTVWWCFTSSWQKAQGWPHTASSHARFLKLGQSDSWLLCFYSHPNFQEIPPLRFLTSWLHVELSQERLMPCQQGSRAERQHDHAARIRTASQMDASRFMSSLCVCVTLFSSLILYQNESAVIKINRNFQLSQRTVNVEG